MILICQKTWPQGSVAYCSKGNLQNLLSETIDHNQNNLAEMALNQAFKKQTQSLYA